MGFGKGYRNIFLDVESVWEVDEMLKVCGI